MQQQQKHEINHLQFPEHEKLNCPRCESTNTKFCYYNNYNLLQPRYYCKNCRRYWTKGGTLRKIPIGGGIRKKSSSSSSSSSVVVVKPAADVAPPVVKAEMLGFGGGGDDDHGGEETSGGVNIGLSIFTSTSSSKVD